MVARGFLGFWVNYSSWTVCRRKYYSTCFIGNLWSLNPFSVIVLHSDLLKGQIIDKNTLMLVFLKKVWEKLWRYERAVDVDGGGSSESQGLSHTAVPPASVLEAEKWTNNFVASSWLSDMANETVVRHCLDLTQRTQGERAADSRLPLPPCALVYPYNIIWASCC